MDAFLTSTGLVALAEIGDKTQLLALVLAARFRRSVPIILGILVATIANHALAGAVGVWLSTLFTPTVLGWVLGLSFLAMAGWTLIPDKLDKEDATVHSGTGVFMATLIAFFLAEMADKTQVATVALAARYDAFVAVVAGTTLGMLIANVPVVYLGDRLSRKLPMKPIRIVTAILFAALGVATILSVSAAPS